MLRTTIVSVSFAMASAAAAQERIADYDNSVRLEYHYIHTGLITVSTGPSDIGETDTHVLLLSGLGLPVLRQCCDRQATKRKQLAEVDYAFTFALTRRF